MRAKTIAITLVIALTSMVMPAIGDDTKTLETRAKLEALVDRYVVSCGAKSEMLNSRSEVIRTSAIRSCRIASFCVTSREALVKEMLENNVEPKSYKVSQFLKEKFKREVNAYAKKVELQKDNEVKLFGVAWEQCSMNLQTNSLALKISE